MWARMCRLLRSIEVARTHAEDEKNTSKVLDACRVVHCSRTRTFRKVLRLFIATCLCSEPSSTSSGAPRFTRLLFVTRPELLLIWLKNAFVSRVTSILCPTRLPHLFAFRPVLVVQAASQSTERPKRDLCIGHGK